MVDPQVIGRRVRTRRMERNLSTRALARRANVSKSTVSRVESGDVEPHAETLNALALALEINYAELVRPSQVRPRIAPPKPTQPPAEIPMVVAKLLCTGRLGVVTDRELKLLVRNARDPEFAGDVGVLELSLLFRRACAAMHDESKKAALDEAFERIRSELAEGD